MTAMVPTLVNGLSGTITATANGVAMAMGAAGLAGTATYAGYKGTKAASQAVVPAIGGEIEGYKAGKASQAAGGGYWEGRNAEMARQKAHRLKYADGASRLAAMRGEQTTAHDRFKAANAGQRFENRRRKHTND